MTELPRIYTCETAGEYLSLTPRRVRELCKSGDIVAKKIGPLKGKGPWRITEQALLDFMHCGTGGRKSKEQVRRRSRESREVQEMIKEHFG